MGGLRSNQSEYKCRHLYVSENLKSSAFHKVSLSIPGFVRIFYLVFLHSLIHKALKTRPVFDKKRSKNTKRPTQGYCPLLLSTNGRLQIITILIVIYMMRSPRHTILRSCLVRRRSRVRQVVSALVPYLVPSKSQK